MTKLTHFGYQKVNEEEKSGKVADVFNHVAQHYDLMNDLMSGGMHRLWKAFAVSQAGVKEGFRVLDIAGGTGDLTWSFSKQVGDTGEVWLTDINETMLQCGRDKLLNRGVLVPTLVCDAEKLPFPDNYFDRVIVSFGLRNMTHKEQALSEMNRVLKPGGKLLVLEFSKVWKPLQNLYDIYSFSVLPWLGKHVAKSADSYRYLAESIRVHPDQATLQKMMEDAGFVCARFFNLTAGVVALHTGMKL
ncbi:bifunctional demethylmenaquinone methyltransferase/2-methoxy-6-polyprenyl-1,4-benzoquinol methylase UbiE [Oxalobacter formigenes]|uniref:Ubiquinone/menaquinone biosynthesis C-methyltransferase UbiE n=1 Tax=Oxalobacter formigenes OXCC13 TaxID=556269 RepID=C3XCJ4_OXAFO|nr:bifunctional demethylmenaquinone methyltransferase/2-methoxy-6-polyprenyl-1,4-benzoquinol methylase UbiE [Oxalobacter formigenes]ARQ44903.1 Ubiquinone/menaquinone biosynthesis C-methyltransferase UbiE [Oxalobacter formigenes]ARQ77231.1 bifunctional demethylmenaquinone methyltransferase/2-methoxy-6-polyprenyl-1,4-benzoquinol methylase [Oxalobacter formigenes OXCC13]EEO30920.1 ubiquinone/menaquinone biosynthesis methyltransferase [Oxalobacter formigenes OXCC13]MCZ4062898.1 bifunctional demethy